jgi:hypothetical protein
MICIRKIKRENFREKIMKKISALESGFVFQVGDLVRYLSYGPPSISGVARWNLGFILNIIEDRNEKQMNMFPIAVIYDTRLNICTQTYSYNLEFISRAPSLF